VPPLETIGLRVLAIVAGLVVWFITQKMIGARTVAPGETYDHLHVVTAGWNRWLHEHPRAANAVLIASSLCVDAVTLFVLVRAVLGPSFPVLYGAEYVRTGGRQQNVFEEWAGLHDGGYLPD